MLLKNKTAIVTGGGRGIGKVIVRHFLDEGANVVAFDNRGQLLRQLEDELQLPGRLAAVAGDVTLQEDVDRLLSAALTRFGQVDILVNNAGIAIFEPFVASSEEVWRRTYEVNVMGAYRCSQTAAAAMINRKQGVILHMSSINGMVGERGMSHYNASKAAILLLNRTMANELAADGIRCVAICPGYILTDMSYEAGVGEDFIAAYAKKIPAGRLGQPEDIAYAAAFLASDRASFITGTELVIDGGQMGFM